MRPWAMRGGRPSLPRPLGPSKTWSKERTVERGCTRMPVVAHKGAVGTILVPPWTQRGGHGSSLGQAWAVARPRAWLCSRSEARVLGTLRGRSPRARARARALLAVDPTTTAAVRGAPPAGPPRKLGCLCGGVGHEGIIGGASARALNHITRTPRANLLTDHDLAGVHAEWGRHDCKGSDSPIRRSGGGPIVRPTWDICRWSGRFCVHRRGLGGGGACHPPRGGTKHLADVMRCRAAAAAH